MKQIIMVLALLTSVGMSLRTANAAVETARKADSFIDSIGVNIKLSYLDTPYGNYPMVKAKLQELGIRHIREGAGPLQDYDDNLQEQRVLDLATVGIKSTLIFSPGTTQPNTSPQQSILNALGRLQSAVIAVEGPNEPDGGFSFNGKGFPAGAIDYQNVLWSTVKNSSYSYLPVLAPSISFPPNSTQIQGMEHVANYGNTHSYHGARNPETTEVNLGLDNFYLPHAQIQTRGKPIIATETGNHTPAGSDWGHWIPPMSDINGNVSQAFGKYAVRTYLHYFNKGIVRTFIHELVDEHGLTTGNPNLRGLAESNFGLYYNNWAPKNAATVIKNTLAVLQDPGANFTPGNLDYTLSGNTANVQRTLLQKRDGRFYLILWQGVSGYNVDTRQDISVPSAAVTLTVNTPVSGARGFIPWSNGTTATALTISNKQISLNVPDHPLIIELTPTSSVPTAPDVIVTQTGYSGTLKVGSPIRFTATMKNQGTASTPTGVLVGIGFYMGNAASPLTWSSVSGVLAAGQSATVSSDATWTPTAAGTYTIKAWADDVNRFSESNETNNTLTQTLTITN